jgi:hypothetical protein
MERACHCACVCVCVCHMQAGAEGSVMLGVIRTVQRKGTGECLATPN